MDHIEKYIKEHKEFAKAQAGKHIIQHFPPGTKVNEAEKEHFYNEYLEQYNELEKVLAKMEETIIHKAMQDGKTDVLELERELAYISHRQLEDYRNLFRLYSE